MAETNKKDLIADYIQVGVIRVYATKGNEAKLQWTFSGFCPLDDVESNVEKILRYLSENSAKKNKQMFITRLDDGFTDYVQFANSTMTIWLNKGIALMTTPEFEKAPTVDDIIKKF